MKNERTTDRKKNSRKIVGVLIWIGVFLCAGNTMAQQKQASGASMFALQQGKQQRSPAADYTFTDSLGKLVKLSDFRGKWLMADVWYSGCGGCITANQGLRTVHDSLAKAGVVFLSISVDKEREKWMASVTAGAGKSKMNPWAGMYVPAVGTVVLYTSGSGHDNEFRKSYVPDNLYPKLLLFDPAGNLVADNPPRPDSKPELLISFIRQQQRAISR